MGVLHDAPPGMPRSCMSCIEMIRLAICKALNVNPVTHSYEYVAKAAVEAYEARQDCLICGMLPQAWMQIPALPERATD